MIVRLALTAALLTAAQTVPAPVPTPAPTPAAPPAASPAPAADLISVAIETSEGRIVVALDRTHAPISTANFLRYVDARRFDGISFYRSMTLPWKAGLIQAGIRDARKLYPPIAHEPTSKTGLSHVEGAISMARLAPGTAAGDFTIMVGDMTGLDAHPGQPGDNLGYAVFGHVVEGMDVVKRIWADPVSPTAGEGAMKGQMLTTPVKIVSIRRAAKAG